MFIVIFSLLLLGQILATCSNFTNRIFKTDSFWKIFIISCIVSVLSNFISFPTIVFLGKTQNVIILSCMLLVGTALSTVILNYFVFKEPIHFGSIITLFLIVIILFIHQILTKNFYDEVKKVI